MQKVVNNIEDGKQCNGFEEKTLGDVPFVSIITGLLNLRLSFVMTLLIHHITLL